jgi:type IV pilus assembly protein PilW
MREGSVNYFFKKTMKSSESGFTLIELMIAMAMAAIVTGIIYSAYNIQTKIYTEQDKVAEMQQNMRAGISYLQREARMAGYNAQDAKDASCNKPGLAGAVAPGIHTATATTFGFSMDLDEDGKCTTDGENVTYAIYTGGDGILKLGRDDNTDAQAQQPIAENISNVDFVYIFSPPLIGSSVVNPPTSTPTATQLTDIVSVQVSLLAQASTQDRKAASTTSFTLPLPNAWGASTAGGTVWGPFTDSVSRRLLTTTINCRNMGLK